MTAKFVFIALSLAALCVASCSTPTESKTETKQATKKEFDFDAYMDSLDMELEKRQNDPAFPEYHDARSQEFLRKAVQESDPEAQKSFLDSALTHYELAITKGSPDPINLLFCGLLSEKLKRTHKANDYYQKARKQGDWNLNHADSIVRADSDHLIRLNLYSDSMYTEDLAMYKHAQEFYIALSDIMLGKEVAGLKKIDEIVQASPDAFLGFALMFGEIRSREDLLNFINLDD